MKVDWSIIILYIDASVQGLLVQPDLPRLFPCMVLPRDNDRSAEVPSTTSGTPPRVHFRFRCPCFQVTPLAGWRSIPKLGVNCTSGNVDQVLPFPALPPIVPLTQGRYHRPDWTNSAANFHFPPCPLTHDPLLSLRDQCSGDHCGYLVSPMMAYCQYMPRFLPSSLHRLFIYFSLVGKG